jgi:hypothetical protein
MERFGVRHGVLRRPVITFAIALLLAAALVAVFSPVSFAADPGGGGGAGEGGGGGGGGGGAGGDDPEGDRLSNDMFTAMTLALQELVYAGEAALQTVMMIDYNNKYIDDHEALDDDLRYNAPMNPFSSVMRTADGYRGGGPNIYSEIFKTRAGGLRETLRRAASANASEAQGIKGATQDEIKKMYEATDEAEGYIGVIQAGTQEANYLNTELLRLRADTLRQTDIQMSAAIEEAQDDFDETSAFEGAVTTWKVPGTGTGF